MYDIDLKELADELDDLREAKERMDSDETTVDEEDGWDEDRFKALEKLETDLRTDLHVAARNIELISESDWVGYCRDQAEDLYGRDNPLWPYVDWERYANDIQSDFTSVEFEDETYYYRA